MHATPTAASSAQSASHGPFARFGLDGPLTFYNGVLYWIVLAAMLGLLLAYPVFGSLFSVTNFTSFLLSVPLALGLTLLWGYGGVLSFGQMAFFGIAAYGYGVIAINLGGGGWTLPAAAAALIGTMGTALVVGYFIFYGRVSPWIVPVLTLVITLILQTFLLQTAGYQWSIGEAHLGGANGMSGIPSLSVAGIEFSGYGLNLYYLVIAIGLAVLLAMRMFANSHAGHVVVAIREDAERTEMLGYDVRLFRLLVFVAAAGLAGVSGILYVSWGNFVTPTEVGLLSATLPVLWVAVGGRTSFTSVAVACVGLEYLSDYLRVYGGQYALVLVGALLLFGMMFAPDGIITTAVERVRILLGGRRD